MAKQGINATARSFQKQGSRGLKTHRGDSSCFNKSKNDRRLSVEKGDGLLVAEEAHTEAQDLLVK